MGSGCYEPENILSLEIFSNKFLIKNEGEKFRMEFSADFHANQARFN